ncbi:MAG: hypothetical protein HUU50_18095 [Candidatus Brocadiae bacterium]|nr:hypothetical protein [Candidatus Brocadiia bacterium]
MFFQKIQMSLFLSLFFLSFISVQAQEKSPIKRLETLESRLLILEDYLKSRLNHLQKTIKDQESTIGKLQEENQILQNGVKKHQEQIKRLEEDILALKAMLASITKIDMAAPSEKQESIAEKPSEEQLKKKQYQDEEIAEWAEQFQSPLGSIRMNAVLKAGKSEKPEADSLLIQALEDKDRYIVMLALKSLSNRKSRSAVYPLLSMLEKEISEMSSSFLSALQSITGIQEDFPLQGNKEEKQKAVQKWREKLKKSGF